MSRRAGLADAVRAAMAGDARLHAWQVRETRRSGLQSYLVGTQLESQRWVEDEGCEAVVFVRKGEGLGRSAITLRAADRERLSERMDEAVFMAGLGGDAPWRLTAEAPATVALHDPALSGPGAREASLRMIEAWRAAVGAQREITPSSMELFCESEDVTAWNSEGLEAQSVATRASLLSILLASGATSAESVSWERRRRASDLDVGEVVGRTADQARDLTRAAPPPSGQYPVVIDAHEIAALFSPLRANASAESLYRKSSRFEVGKPLPIAGAGGEPIGFMSNAIVPFGLSSYAIDGDGIAGRRVEIVRDNVFVRPWATKQFADYLGAEPTGGFGNLEVPPGETPLADLLSGDGPVLHVREFSWLTPDQARGNFGSEIRVGYLYERGTMRPVKGGTVSGSLFAVLGSARRARESVFLGDYLGTAAIRFEGLSVTGV